MPARLEIALKDHLIDAEGEGIRQKALDYFGMQLSRVRSIHILTIDAELSPDQLLQIQTEIFTNPVTQLSSFEPLDFPFDWTIWVGYRPGVRDNPGATAVEAIEDDEEEGAIILSAWHDAGQDIIHVADTGPGMPPEARDKLFKPFQGSTRKGGTGLGLPNVLEIASAHGGEVTLVKSDSTGTIFAISLPHPADAM